VRKQNGGLNMHTRRCQCGEHPWLLSTPMALSTEGRNRPNRTSVLSRVCPIFCFFALLIRPFRARDRQKRTGESGHEFVEWGVGLVRTSLGNVLV
jgi:hypothetical protein